MIMTVLLFMMQWAAYFIRFRIYGLQFCLPKFGNTAKIPLFPKYVSKLILVQKSLTMYPEKPYIQNPYKRNRVYFEFPAKCPPGTLPPVDAIISQNPSRVEWWLVVEHARQETLRTEQPSNTHFKKLFFSSLTDRNMHFTDKNYTFGIRRASN